MSLGVRCLLKSLNTKDKVYISKHIKTYIEYANSIFKKKQFSPVENVVKSDNWEYG